MEYVPGGVAPEVLTVNVEDLADASVIAIVAGPKFEVESLEIPLTLREIVPLNPPAGVAVTV